jgi:hypothetical protein
MRGALTLAALLLAAGASAQTAAPGASPCATPEHGQFDFWVGDWDVYKRGGDKLVAHSRIEKLYDGCAIRENWMPLKNSGGGSLSTYDSGARKWRQTWIDNGGARVDFEGGMQGMTMVLEGHWPGLVQPGKDALIRMSYAVEPDGSVRQWGVASEDGGKSWSPSFDFIYRRAQDGP